MTANVQIASNLLDHHQSMFSKLFTKGDFSDVTLVSDDKIRIKAHKFVLSAFSPVFEKIIDDNPTHHPLIYLRGIQSQELVSLLQFLYQGETILPQNRIEEFANVAKDLEVEKITKVLEEIEKSEWFQVLEQNRIQVRTVKLKPPPPSQKRLQTVKLKPRTLESPGLNTEPGAGFKSQVNVAKIAEDIRKDIEKQIDPLAPDENEDANSLSESKETKTQVIKVKELKQTGGPENIECPECGKMFKGNSMMFNHFKLRHGEKSFQCPSCDKKYPSKLNLSRHFRNKHQNIKYPCNLCDYQATTAGDAKKHRDGKHSNIILSCDFCHFQTRWRSEYRRHMTTHESPEQE